MVLRRLALHNKMVLGVAGMTVVLDRDHWSRLLEGQRNLLVAPEVLKRQGYGCETVDYL